jgi:general stress protein 26
MKVDKNDILEVMDQAEAVYLATVSGSAPRIRAMVNHRRKDIYPGPSEFARAGGFTVYFCTSAASGKVHELRANPAAAAYFAVPYRFRGVMLTGDTEVLEDMKLKEALWHEGWRFYWPGGPSDPDCVVVRLTPKEATGWWGSEPFYLDLRAI